MSSPSGSKVVTFNFLLDASGLNEYVSSANTEVIEIPVKGTTPRRRLFGHKRSEIFYISLRNAAGFRIVNRKKTSEISKVIKKCLKLNTSVVDRSAHERFLHSGCVQALHSCLVSISEDRQCRELLSAFLDVEADDFDHGSRRSSDSTDLLELPPVRRDSSISFRKHESAPALAA